MRLFLAICFEERVKSQLMKAVQRLEANSSSGRFTVRDNLHLTLVFLGNADRLEDVKSAMGSIYLPQPFAILLDGVGCFDRPGGAIYWMAVQDNPLLIQIYHDLWHALKYQGFSPEDRPYRPHLTLGRNVTLNPGYCKEELTKGMSAISAAVDRISLVQSSVNKDNLPEYTEIFSVPL